MAIQVGGTTVIDNSRQLNVVGVSTLGTVQISSGIVTATTTSGIVTYYGDGSKLTGISAVVDGQYFNTGITSSFTAVLTGIGDTILTLPSTAGQEYIVYSIHAANIGLNTDVNVIGAFDFSGYERSYFAYNIPIPTGMAVELLLRPQILNPSDKIVMRATDYDRVGINSAVQVFVTYHQKTASNYFGLGFGPVGINTTARIGIYTATTASILQSIRLANRTDLGGYPISITVTSGTNTSSLVSNLIVPKYGSIEILETPKRLNLNDVLKLEVEQLSSVDVQISGITASS